MNGPQVKQICYGILYGIGNKALSETLEICEEEANVFIFSFMKTYPGVRKFIDSVLADCKKNGYVKTIGGRRRYLPNIQSKYSLSGNLILFIYFFYKTKILVTCSHGFSDFFMETASFILCLSTKLASS